MREALHLAAGQFQVFADSGDTVQPHTAVTCQRLLLYQDSSRKLSRPILTELYGTLLLKDVRTAERAAAEIQKMGIGGKRMSAADYRAARRAGTIGASAVGSHNGDAAQWYCRVSESALLTTRMHQHAWEPLQLPPNLCL